MDIPASPSTDASASPTDSSVASHSDDSDSENTICCFTFCRTCNWLYTREADGNNGPTTNPGSKGQTQGKKTQGKTRTESQRKREEYIKQQQEFQENQLALLRKQLESSDERHFSQTAKYRKDMEAKDTVAATNRLED